MEERNPAIVDLSALAFVFLCGLVHTSTCLPEYSADLQSPHSVRVEANAAHSLTLSWSPPLVPADGPQLMGYSVVYLSGTASEEIVKRVDPEKHDIMLTNLQPASNYTVQVLAHYSNNQNASSLKFVVSTLASTSHATHQECDCHMAGMASCFISPSSGESKCTCLPGYTDRRCESCQSDFYPEGDRCVPCNCSTSTSTGSCTPNVGEEMGRECSCLPGHFGASCTACTTGYFWYEDSCLQCDCLHMCPQGQGHDICNNCELSIDPMAEPIQRCPGINGTHRKKQANRNDGTVAVVAVVVSLAFIASVAGGVSYYRYKCQKQAQHSSLWSMELHEEKVSLNSACDYQRLDAAAINAKQDAKKQKNRLAAHNKAEGNHKYHCISI